MKVCNHKWTPQNNSSRNLKTPKWKANTLGQESSGRKRAIP
jgi:hypothetical protein